MLIINKISKITSSSARLIDTTVASLHFGWFAVFVVLTKTLQSITQAKNLHVTKREVASIEMA